MRDLADWPSPQDLGRGCVEPSPGLPTRMRACYDDRRPDAAPRARAVRGSPSTAADFSRAASDGLGMHSRALAAPITNCVHVRGTERRTITSNVALSSRTRCSHDQRRGRSRPPRRHARADSSMHATEERVRGWARMASIPLNNRCATIACLALRPLLLIRRAYATLLLTRRGMVLLLSPPA